MGYQIGYDQLDKGDKFYVKLPIKFYNNLVLKLTHQENLKESFLFKFYILTSTYANKYALKLKNLFFYQKSDNNIIHVDAEISTKTKLMRMINFDISPIIKLTVNNLPFNLSMKYGKYQANRNQIINKDVNFSKVLKSMLPYKRLGLSLSNLFPIFNNSIYKIKASFNKLFHYENNLKLSNQIRTHLEYPFKFFNLSLTNDFLMKKSLIFADKLLKNEYKEHHIISGFRCLSRLLEMNLLKHENEIDSGSDFYISNLTTIRLSDFPYLKGEFTKRINPYCSIESFILPNRYVNKIKDIFHYIISVGLSLKIQDNMFIDFSLYSRANKNLGINNKYVNRFRIKISN